MDNELIKQYKGRVDVLQEDLQTKSEDFWMRRGEEASLRLFHEMAARVPAYQDFLKQHKVNAQKIKTIKDFKHIPPVDKDNYLRKYSRRELCWDGQFAEKSWVISTTSGSTGKPYYFPRQDLQDEYYALSAELYLRENFQIQDKSTLYIDAFAMGAWIGGVFTYEAITRVAQKGYNLSIITPGINKTEVINSVRELGKDFDQVIVGCYPPIMKDIIDYGNEEELDWSKYNLGIVFSAEGFSEEFRDYILKHADLSNIYTSTLNHYGTVDLGTMSHETPVAIKLRRDAVENKALFSTLFGEIRKQPTLTQYIPELFYFEENEGGLLCSSNSGIPLLRYDLKDHGGIFGNGYIVKAYKKQNKDFDEELRKSDIFATKWNLPYVYLYERSDFSVSFTGAQIYPEEIRRALLDPTLHQEVTGKFTMISGYDTEAQNYLELNIELRKNIDVDEKLAEKIKLQVVQKLLEENSEYRVLYGEYESKLHPRIKLWQHGHPLHFGAQGKQKWVKKV